MNPASWQLKVTPCLATEFLLRSPEMPWPSGETPRPHVKDLL